MRLATIRTADGTRAVKLEDDVLVDLGAYDLGEFLAQAGWETAAEAAGVAKGSATYPLGDADFAPVVPKPSKVICVGHNYKSHILEMGREIPDYPVLFAKFFDTLTGPYDDVVKPAETDKLDWECELAIIIGQPVRHATESEAITAIAGFSALDDLSMRDYQFRTREWLQGKMWEATTPVGPYVTTPDELPGGVRPALNTRLTVDGVEKQHANTSDLLFDPVFLVQYISTITTLRPGDIIATGTNGGVGHARDPQEFLMGGESVVVEIEGIGRLENKIVKVGA